MSEENSNPIPSEIKLHQRTRTLELTFGDGAHFMLSAEYLRVYSPAADNMVDMQRGVMATGKEKISITRVTPVGNYAIRLAFSDGHDAGIYSWQMLYDLGTKQDGNWQAYLDWLTKKGLEREQAGGGGTIRIIYFAKLVDRIGRGSEQADLPQSVTDVGSLLAWLRKRGGNWDTFLRDDDVRVTVNREFASLDSGLKSGDEVAIVPSHPH